MKKRMIAILSLIVSMSFLMNGCQKSNDAETSYDQIKADAKQELEDNKKFKEKQVEDVAAASQKWVPKIKETGTAYNTSQNPDDIIKSAEKFNAVYADICKELNRSVFSPYPEIESAFGEIRSNKPYQISQAEYTAKSLYYKAVAVNSDYEYMTCFFNKKTSELLYALRKVDSSTGLMNQLLIIKPDGGNMGINISEYINGEYMDIKLETVTQDMLIISTLSSSGDYGYLEFDISGDNANLKKQESGVPDNQTDFRSVDEQINENGLNSILSAIAI